MATKKKKKQTVGDLITRIAHDSPIFKGVRASTCAGWTMGAVNDDFAARRIKDELTFDPGIREVHTVRTEYEIPSADLSMAMKPGAGPTNAANILVDKALEGVSEKVEGSGELVVIKIIRLSISTKNRAVELGENPTLTIRAAVAGARIEDPEKQVKKDEAVAAKRAAKRKKHAEEQRAGDKKKPVPKAKPSAKKKPATKKKSTVKKKRS